MHNFSPINPEALNDNVFKLLDKDWMLVTAGTLDHYNTMTASWGHMGIIWNLPVAIAWIRPQRHTYQFTEKYSHYTLSFFTEEYRKALQFCGTKSGRDYDKAKETGLTAVATENGNVFFREARLVMECRKLYADDLKEEKFIDPKIASKHYPTRDFHRFYMGEITGAIQKNGA